MWIERKYETKLKKIIKTFPALLLTGPRQVGKTSLLKHCFPDYSYVTLDIPSQAEKAEKNPDIFLRSRLNLSL